MCVNSTVHVFFSNTVGYMTNSRLACFLDRLNPRHFTFQIERDINPSFIFSNINSSVQFSNALPHCIVKVVFVLLNMTICREYYHCAYRRSLLHLLYTPQGTCSKMIL